MKISGSFSRLIDPLADDLRRAGKTVETSTKGDFCTCTLAW